MAHLLAKLKNWWTPDKTPEPPPAPTPVPAPPPAPSPMPEVTPSGINAINYVRALMILRKIDFKKLREEFLKLPLKKLAIAIGVIAWCALSYWLFRLVTGGIPLK